MGSRDWRSDEVLSLLGGLREIESKYNRIFSDFFRFK